MLSVALFFGYLAEAELQLGKVLFFKKSSFLVTFFLKKYFFKKVK
jgi:hypothetical protein